MLDEISCLSGGISLKFNHWLHFTKTFGVKFHRSNFCVFNFTSDFDITFFIFNKK